MENQLMWCCFKLFSHLNFGQLLENRVRKFSMVVSSQMEYRAGIQSASDMFSLLERGSTHDTHSFAVNAQDY